METRNPKHEAESFLALLSFHGPPGPPSGSSLGSLELPQGIYFQGDEGRGEIYLDSPLVLSASSALLSSSSSSSQVLGTGLMLDW